MKKENFATDMKAFGDRMKAFERTTEQRLNPALPICIRIDGRSFSKYTKGYQKPFDDRISIAMRAAAKAVVKESHAKIGFVQSDEITLILINEGEGSVLFDGRVLKLASVLASVAAVAFDRSLRAEKAPAFDCRVWQLPSKEEAANALLWRAQDARRNGVSSTYRSRFSAKQMLKKTLPEMLAGLAEIGVDYETAFPIEDRQGMYFQRVSRPRKIPEEVWNQIPKRQRPESRIMMRSAIEAIPMPYFARVANPVGVIFDGEVPLSKEA